MEKLLHQFKTVADLKHLGAASKVLYISQPALTKNIQKLEERYGVQLFERHSRGMLLTKFGQLLLKHCIHIECEYNLIDRGIEALSHGKKGDIVIGCGFAYSSLLIPILEKIYTLYPDLSISLVRGEQEYLLQGVLTGEIDFVFTGIDSIISQEKSTVIEYIMDIDYSVVVGLEHPLTQVKNIQLTDLAGYKWLQFALAKDHMFSLQKHFVKNKMETLDIALTSNCVRAVNYFLHQKDYLMLCPTILAEKEFNATILDVDSLPTIQLPTGAFYLPVSSQISYIRNILDFICNELKKTL